MSISLGVFTFIVTWSVVLFAVLPWGITTPDNPEPMHDAGAPENPRLAVKFLITTLIAALITAILCLMINSGIVQLQEKGL